VKYSAQANRTKVLKLARDMARSGQHANHVSILAELETVRGFVDAQPCFTNRVLTAQLDRLCAMAQTAAPANASALAAFLADARARRSGPSKLPGDGVLRRNAIAQAKSRNFNAARS
jgi:hypothetical protein